jgi:hypothetical protein
MPQKVHILIPGKYSHIEAIKQSNLASIRLRSAVVADELSKEKIKFSFGEEISDEVKTVLIGKIGGHLIETRANSWLNQIKKAKDSGAKIILDYTDNHAGFKGPMSQFYESALKLADCCVTPSKHMQFLLKPMFKLPSFVIPDPIEVPIYPPKISTSNTALWFGHASNIQYLIKFIENIPNQYNFNLITLSNPEGLRILASHPFTIKKNIKIQLYDWSVSNMIEASKVSNFCIIPSNKNDSFKSGASSNRLITALALGLPTAATMLPSYIEFSKYFIDIDSVAFQENKFLPSDFTQIITEAQETVIPNFSISSIGKKWLSLLSHLS